MPDCGHVLRVYVLAKKYTLFGECIDEPPVPKKWYVGGTTFRES